MLLMVDGGAVSGSASWYTRLFWAKAWPYRQRGPDRVHLLEHHLADVGACFEVLVDQPTIRRGLAHTAGWEVLDEATVATVMCLCRVA